MKPGPIVVHDQHGRRVFAFSPATDPYEVLLAVAWAHPNGAHVCGTWPRTCPAVDGDYCPDCHVVAYEALEAARERFPEGA